MSEEDDKERIFTLSGLYRYRKRKSGIEKILTMDYGVSGGHLEISKYSISRALEIIEEGEIPVMEGALWIIESLQKFLNECQIENAKGLDAKIQAIQNSIQSIDDPSFTFGTQLHLYFMVVHNHKEALEKLIGEKVGDLTNLILNNL